MLLQQPFKKLAYFVGHSPGIFGSPRFPRSTPTAMAGPDPEDRSGQATDHSTDGATEEAHYPGDQHVFVEHGWFLYQRY